MKNKLGKRNKLQPKGMIEGKEGQTTTEHFTHYEKNDLCM